MNNYSNLQQKEQKPTAAEDKISFLSSHIFLDQQQQQTSTIKKKSVGLSGLPLMLARTHRWNQSHWWSILSTSIVTRERGLVHVTTVITNASLFVFTERKVTQFFLKFWIEPCADNSGSGWWENAFTYAVCRGEAQSRAEQEGSVALDLLATLTTSLSLSVLLWYSKRTLKSWSPSCRVCVVFYRVKTNERWDAARLSSSFLFHRRWMGM